MNLDYRKWVLAVFLGLLALLPDTANAGMTPDEVKAFEGYKAKAYQGNAGAQFGLGFCYTQGQGVAKDAAEGVKWYRKAADQGIAGAQFNLGMCYFYGNGVTKDAAEAVKWYRKAADQGIAGAQYCLGCCFRDGDGVAKDEAEVVKWYRKSADQGYVAAQFNLGLCYASGQGVAKDGVEAAKWVRKAAEQGNASAQYYLGCCFRDGDGVTKDFVQAVAWYRKAADQGNAGAQYYLGVFYEAGQGVAKDPAEAVKWYRKVADRGVKGAQSNLGLCYANGLGVAKDEVEAVKWFRKAADQGYPDAQYYLGLCFANGQGVAKDEVEAAKWNRKAADQGLAVAQSNNSLDTQQYEQRSFLVGDTTISLPIPKNYREADRKVRWVAELNKVSEQGHADSSQNFHVLINLLTKKPGIPANIEASPQDYMDSYVLTLNKFDYLKCPLEDFSKEMKTFETQLTGGNSDQAWKELVKKTFEQNRFVGAEAKAVAFSFGKPTCIERTNRHVIAAYPGDRVVIMSIVLNRGKILSIYISKTESETLAGIREMKGWVAEIENTTPAEGEVPSKFWNAIVEGGGRGVAFFVFSSVGAAIIYALKRSRKQGDKEVPNPPPPL
jgi:TPR repeat protein